MNPEFPEEDDFPLVPRDSDFWQEYRIYRALGLHWVPPEHREGNKEKVRRRMLSKQTQFVPVDTSRPKTLRDYIPMFCGRPDRTTVINDEDCS